MVIVFCDCIRMGLVALGLGIGPEFVRVREGVWGLWRSGILEGVYLGMGQALWNHDLCIFRSFGG